MKTNNWNKWKISTRGTVILSWLLLIGTAFKVFFGNGDINESFVKEVFYFALLVNLGSTIGLNGIETLQEKIANTKRF